MSQRYRIVSAMNGMAITVSQGQRKSRPGDLLLENYKGVQEQQFFIEKINTTECKIRSVAQPNKVIDLINESIEVYKQIILYEYHGKPNQKWQIIDLGNHTVQIRSCHSKLVLQTQGGIDAEGVALVQNTNYKNKSQIWRIEAV